MMRTGHCHCNEVRYVFDGEPTDASFCHCSICRRLTGSAFGSWCEVPNENFRWLACDAVATYQVTDRLETLFCRNCGVTLVAKHSKWPGCKYVLLGTLDDDGGIAPEYHQFTGSRASWYKIHDSMPQYDAWPDSE
jgi:hypothetical protein